MAPEKTKEGNYSPEETKLRMEAALRGARIAGAKHKVAAKPAKRKQAKKKS